MKACAICDDRTSLLACSHFGSICFDCWGSGIHEAMKRNSSELREQLSTRFKRVCELIYGSKAEIPPVCPVCKEESHRWLNLDGSRRWHCIICNREVRP